MVGVQNQNRSRVDNSGLPFGPADFTAGVQWGGGIILPGTSALFRVYLVVNAPFPNLLFADGFEGLFTATDPD